MTAELTSKFSRMYCTMVGSAYRLRADLSAVVTMYQVKQGADLSTGQSKKP